MFYDRFVELCKNRGVSPSAVMISIGLNKSNATFWKKGSIPKGDTLQKLADYFGVSVDYLLDIKPLPAKIERIVTGQEFVYGSVDQEFFAVDSFIEEMGYTITLELSIDEINPVWTLYDRRAGKKYCVPTNKLNKLTNSISSFTKYQIAEMISELIEIPEHQAPPAPQPPAAPAEDTDTTPHPEGLERPQEDE